MLCQNQASQKDVLVPECWTGAPGPVFKASFTGQYDPNGSV